MHGLGSGIASVKAENLQPFKKLKRAHPTSCSQQESVHPGKDVVGSKLVDPCVVC